MTNKRIAVIAGVLVVACAVAFIALRGYPPTPNTQGTIGAAQRYQSDQLAEKDVHLTDAQVQAFLQSDMFHKIATQPAFREEVKNGNISRLMSVDGFSGLMKSDQFSSLMSDNAFASVVADQNFQKVVSNDGYRSVMLSDGFVQLAKTDGFRSMIADQAYINSLHGSKEALAGKADYQKIVDSQQYQALAQNADYSRMVQDGAFAQLAKTDGFAALMNSADLQKIVATDGMRTDFQKVVASDGFHSAMASDGFRSLLQVDGMKNVLASDAFQVVAQRGTADLSKIVDGMNAKQTAGE
jgi:hypothetical protein